MDKHVSIVICTYNRAAFLNRTLYSLKRLHYKNFEVIVVAGPCTDDTDKVLERYKGYVKLGNNPLENLSVSRNIGIRLSAGEIIAFIDDDAIPDRFWLDDIVSLYTDSSVGGVGGKVFDPLGTPYSFERGCVDMWGLADIRYTGEDLNDPSGTQFNLMLGTNCTFSREALLAVSGFDEYYDYFHDESDLCVRVIKAGYKILHHKQAYIHHEFAKSHIRTDEEGIMLNWYPIIKNKVYFALKNSQGLAGNREQENKVRQILSDIITDFKGRQYEGKLTEAQCREFIQAAREGFEKGYESGRNGNRLLGSDLNGRTEFLKYNPEEMRSIYSICLLCRDNIFDSIGGVAKYSHELAKGYARAGHIVHVITAGDDESSWTQDGICVHTVTQEGYRVPAELQAYPSTYNCLNYSYSAYKKVENVSAKYGLDIIESALWNFEGAVTARLLKDNLPVVVRLQTPLRKVIETQKWEQTKDLEVFTGFECALLKDARHIISISDAITKTIEELYNLQFDEKKLDKVYLGVDEPGKAPEFAVERIKILFIGRLERRKGIHTIFEVLPNLMSKYTNIEFIFLGNDDIADSILGCSYKEYFLQTWGSQQWSDRVAFLGQAGNEIKEKELAECSMLVAPSLYESFGLILVEAMSAGKPVIACRAGGMQEIVADGETGCLIGVENSGELYDAIAKLIENRQLRRQLGEAGYNRYIQVFSNRAMAEQSLEVYKKLV